jgi:Rnl2 family RNA ligase
MTFKKYSSIENGYRKKYIGFVREHPEFDDVKFQATEKIDGSHLSFVVDADTMNCRIGKRSGLTDGSFYNCYEVFARYHLSTLALSEQILNDSSGVGVIIKSIQIEGELYGEGVQNRVKYGAKDFAAFDIQVIGEMNEEPVSYYLSPDMVLKLCDRHGIPHAPVIEESVSFEDAMALPVVFDTLIGSVALPDNKAEGIVLKPTKPLHLGNGSRVIIKNKNEAFAEKAKKKKVKPPADWSDEMTRVWGTMEEFNTENRIRSAISKMGAISQKDFGKLLGAVSHDLLEDWVKEHSYGSLEKSEQKVLTKRLNNDVKALIRANFLNILDGVF